MYTKKWLASTWMLVVLCITANAQAPENERKLISFQEAFEMASLHNPAILRAKEKLAQAEQELKAARGYYFPQVGVSATAIALSENLTFDLSPVRDAIVPLYQTMGTYGNFSGVPNPDPNTAGVMPVLPDNISTQVVRSELMKGAEKVNNAEWEVMIQERYFATLSANVTMPLYMGGKIRAANHAAAIKFRSAETELNNAKGELMVEVAQRYFGLALAHEALSVRSKVLQTMEKHFNDAQKMMNGGLISRAEYLHAGVVYAEADREYKKAVQQIELVTDGLNNSLATTGETYFPVTALFLPENIEPESYYQAQAALSNAQLTKVRQYKELAHQGYKAELAEMMPQIAAMGTYELANKNLSPIVPEYMVGVGLKWSLFDGGSNYRKVKAARLQESQVDFMIDKAGADISLGISHYYTLLGQYREQLNELDKAALFADEYLRVRQKAFAEGMATSTEVSEAGLAVEKVQIERLQVLYNFDVALANLLYLAGEPDVILNIRPQSADVN